MSGPVIPSCFGGTVMAGEMTILGEWTCAVPVGVVGPGTVWGGGDGQGWMSHLLDPAGAAGRALGR